MFPGAVKFTRTQQEGAEGEGGNRRNTRTEGKRLNKKIVLDALQMIVVFGLKGEPMASEKKCLHQSLNYEYVCNEAFIR